MADKRFGSSRYNAKRRETAKKLQNSWELRTKQEEKILKKQKEIQRYASVVNIISKELLKRENIECSYIRLYPIIKEILESSKTLSSRYGEKDLPIITAEVVRKYHHIISLDKENTAKDEIEL